MSNILELKNVNKEYKDFSLSNVSFSLEEGYIMGLIGPNGAGKSTTIKLIMNLVRKTSGEINVFGLDNIKHEKEIKEKIGFVYDENYFYEELTITEMKSIISKFYKGWDDQKFNQYISDFDLQPRKKIKDLSKGMKMKFSLAVALSHNARLIVMDEPTSGLDPVFRREILDILYSMMQNDKMGILFSTHITTDLEKIADYITFVNKGKVNFSLPKDEITENYAMIKGDRNLLDKDIKNEFIGIRENAFGFEALTSNVNRIRKIFGNRIVTEKASLDDIMVYSVRGDLNV